MSDGFERQGLLGVGVGGPVWAEALSAPGDRVVTRSRSVTGRVRCCQGPVRGTTQHPLLNRHAAGRKRPVMKEIIYIQAGNTSNHIGTHFWNAQQSYFDYSASASASGRDSDKEVLVDHDVSFREGVSPGVRHLPYVCFTDPGGS